MELLRGHLPAGHRTDLRTVHFRGKAAAVEQRGQIFLKTDLFEQDAVPNREIDIGVAVKIFEAEFLDQTGFQLMRGTADPHADLAGSVAAEHRTFLHDESFDAVPCRRDGGAHAGQTAADHTELNPMYYRFHKIQPPVLNRFFQYSLLFPGNNPEKKRKSLKKNESLQYEI